jgi:hypothetical protein
MAVPGATLAGGGIPLGYQQISAATLAAATGLTIPANATIALVSVDTAAVRWRDDGVAPTAAIGMQMLAGSSLTFSGASLTAVKFILATAGPVLNVVYY